MAQWIDADGGWELTVAGDARIELLIEEVQGTHYLSLRIEVGINGYTETVQTADDLEALVHFARNWMNLNMDPEALIHEKLA